MKRLLSLFAICLMFVTSTYAFYDVDVESRFHKAIDYVQSAGIVSGYADGTFKSDSSINRAEMLKIVIEANYDQNEIDTCIANDISDDWFTDVSLDAWYAPYVCVAKINDVVDGYDDETFQPGNDITFVEALKITSVAFDIDIVTGSTWYEGYVNAASENNLIPLTIDSLEKEISRGEMADMIARFVEDEVGDLENYLEDEMYFRVDLEVLEEKERVEDEYQAFLLLSEQEKEERIEEGLIFMVMNISNIIEVDDGLVATEANNEIVWQVIDIGTNEDLYAVYFYDSNNGWIVGDNATLFKTTDGGSHWTEIDTHKNDGGFEDIYFQSPQTNYIAVNSFFMWRTTF